MKIHAIRLVNPPRKAQPPTLLVAGVPHRAGHVRHRRDHRHRAHGATASVIGLTANSFNSVSLDPPLVLWSLAQRGGFAAGVQRRLALRDQHAGGRPEDAGRALRPARAPTAGTASSFAEGTGGAPLLHGAAATFECFNRSRYEEGDHVIFVGEVERCSWRRRRVAAAVPRRPLLHRASRC